MQPPPARRRDSPERVEAMSSTWPLEATPEDDLPLPASWDRDLDISEPHIESTLLGLQYTQPTLVVNVCRRAFDRAQLRDDQHAALHALLLAYSTLYNASRHALGERVLRAVLERARGVPVSVLSIRIDLFHSRSLSEQGEHAQAMIVRQRALDRALALGEPRAVCVALGALAVSALDSGDAELALSLCEQQQPLLNDDDVVMAVQRNHRANTMALAWLKIAQTRDAAGEPAAACAALQQARGLATFACTRPVNDRAALDFLETLVQVLLRLDEVAEARAQVERCTASLSATPSIGSELWCLLELARMRIDVHEGVGGQDTVQRLLQVEASMFKGGAEVHVIGVEMRQVLVQAQEQLCQYEQALASHKHMTGWHARRRTAQARQRLKLLRHSALAMRAEAVEFIAHDLLTPLAAAQTWLQALHARPAPAACVASLREARTLLERTATLSDRYLGLLRAELMPRALLQVLDIGALADDVCESIVPAAASGLRFTRTIDIGTPVLGDATLLTKALAALLADAFSGAPADTLVELRLKHDITQGTAMLSIGHLTAAGPMPSARMQRHRWALDHDVFSDEHLGLALAAKVCRLHRMRLRFDRPQARGSRLRLTMKTVAAGAAARAGAATVAPGTDLLNETVS
jgi:signal transduction histidine kinase